MNSTVETIEPCKKLLRVELTAEEIEEALTAMARDFQRRLPIPGFRPGKAPLEMVVKAYASDIEREAKAKLLGDHFRKALKEHGLHIAGKTEMEEGAFKRGEPFFFTATMETEPDFELPDYTKLPVKRDDTKVPEEEVERALEQLREQKAVYQKADRPVQAGDFVVVNYSGACEGKPIAEIAPASPGFGKQQKFWLLIEPGYFVPGFTDQLLGALPRERRTVKVQFPVDFVEQALAGKEAVYQVEILAVNIKVRPELGDELAKAYKAANLEELRAGVRKDLENELAYRKKRQVRNQLLATLLGRVSFDLPESMVKEETKQEVYEIVRASTERGVPMEAIDQRSTEIYGAASRNAKEQVKARILLRRIAAKENFQASDPEILEQVLYHAKRRAVKPAQLLREFQEQGLIDQIREAIVREKVMEHLESQAELLD